MTASHFTADGKQEKYEEIFCSLELTRGMHSQFIFLLVLNTILSVTAFLGNTLILLALKKETHCKMERAESAPKAKSAPIS